jgi:hypothetical protein
MQQSLYIIVNANCVHEDEGVPGSLVVVAVAARGFPFAVIQVKQSLTAHDLKVLTELWIDPLKNLGGLALQFRYRIKWLQGLSPEWINLKIPGSQGIYSQSLAALLEYRSGSWHDHLFNGLTELSTIIGGVIEPQQLFPTVSTVVQACIRSNSEA